MDSNTEFGKVKMVMEIEPQEESLSLEKFIREYMERLEREGVILGLSGGVDSAVVAALCKRSVGPEKTLALIMPEKDSKKENIEDAIQFAKELGIRTRLIDITPYLTRLEVYKLAPLSRIPFTQKLRGHLLKRAYRYYERKTGENPFSAAMTGLKEKKFSAFIKKGNAYYRIKHRIRMVLLYLYGEIENRLVVGAANKSEYQIGYFVKHGCDHATDIMPLLNLYKTQIRKLARYLEIPSRIIEKPPSPDILPEITDEEAIGMSYEKLDLVLLALERGVDPPEIAQYMNIEEKEAEYVETLMHKSEHMRKNYTPKESI